MDSSQAMDLLVRNAQVITMGEIVELTLYKGELEVTLDAYVLGLGVVDINVIKLGYTLNVVSFGDQMSKLGEQHRDSLATIANSVLQPLPIPTLIWSEIYIDS